MTVLSTVATPAIGALFGVALAAPPGPMNAVIAEESVRRGWSAGFRAGLGAMAADVLFFGLTLAGVATILQQHATLQDLLFLAGGVLMLVFAVDAARAVRTADFVGSDVEAIGTGFQKAFSLSLSNPYQIAFWLTAGVGLVRPGTLALADHAPWPLATLLADVVVATGSPLLLVGFFGGIGLWIVGFPAGLVAMGRRIDAFAPLVAGGSAALLAGFGLLFCWIGLTALV